MKFNTGFIRVLALALFASRKLRLHQLKQMQHSNHFVVPVVLADIDKTADGAVEASNFNPVMFKGGHGGGGSSGGSSGVFFTGAISF